MSPVLIGAGGLAVLLGLMALRVPVAFAMIVAGVGGIGLLNSWPAAFSTLFTETWGTLTYVELTVIPLFVLMGNIASASGMSRDLYNLAYALIGRFRGGLAHATILGCTGFAALSGSSVASALTLGRVALPEMDRFNYDPKFAAGSVAAGGTPGHSDPAIHRLYHLRDPDRGIDRQAVFWQASCRASSCRAVSC